MDAVMANIGKHPDVKEIYLHVQTSNEEALRFYRRYGFEVAEKLEGYYKRIDPPDCFVLRKWVNGGKAAAAGAAATSPEGGAPAKA